MPHPSLLIVHVADLPASLRFYQAVLGQAPDEASASFAMFRMPSGLSIGLWARPDRPAGSVEIDWVVADPDAVHAAWAAQGVPVVEPPSDQEFGRSFVAADPDGLRLRVLRPAEAAS